jgi:transcriptional regulator with XRE-family HTH domain
MDYESEIEQLRNSIQRRRKELRLSQYDMADKLGMSQNNYSRIERGDAALTLKALLKIGNVLGVDLISELASLKNKESLMVEVEDFEGLRSYLINTQGKELGEIKAEIAQLKELLIKLTDKS